MGEMDFEGGESGLDLEELAAVDRAVEGGGEASPGEGAPSAGGAPDPGADTWTGPSPDEWNAVMGFVQTYGPIIAQATELQQQQGPPQPQPQPQQDPSYGYPAEGEYLDATDPRQLQQLAAQAAAQTISPIVPMLQEFQQERVQQQVSGWISGAVPAAEGATPEQVAALRNEVELVATAYLPHFRNPWTGDLNPQAAIQHAAQLVTARHQAIRDQAVAQYKQQLGALSAVKGEPGTGGSVTEIATRPVDELDAARRYVESHR